MRRISNYALVMIVGAFVLSGTFVSQSGAVIQASAQSATTSVSSATSEAPTVEFTLTVQDEKPPFAFVYDSQDNPTLHVHQGDIVNVTLINNGTQPHDFTLQGYEIKTKVLSPGQSDSIVFKADTTGTFTYYCSVPGHKDLGMQGQLIVD